VFKVGALALFSVACALVETTNTYGRYNKARVQRFSSLRTFKGCRQKVSPVEQQPTPKDPLTNLGFAFSQTAKNQRSNERRKTRDGEFLKLLKKKKKN
jgi:hypothetical protein